MVISILEMILLADNPVSLSIKHGHNMLYMNTIGINTLMGLF